MDALQPVIRKATREAKKVYPTVSEDTARRVATVRIGLAVQHMDANDDMLNLYFQDAVVKAVENGEDWATEVTRIHLDKVIRPTYDKAVEAGVDPVPVLQVNCGISEREAQSMVEAFEKDAAKAETDKDVPAQDPATSA